ncbi:probable cytochrome P450 304a1 [Chelonus insularis]|uniref:probable cytochrome P450 304a1 n=1 Tax=Chelonus insularis TaxID=460826 RepID=UPI00158D4B4F|nr:probable cytochrome P450 304a1 [Chelonus insularis]
MDLVLFTVAVSLLIYLSFLFATKKPENTPPGIIRLPIWGSYWLLLWGNYKFPHQTLNYYVKKYKSKVISGYLGEFFTIFVNDYQSVREVLTRREFEGRLNTVEVFRARAFGKKLGIFFNDDYEWQEQKRFALRNLRNFGFGRRHGNLEDDLNEEVQILIDTIKYGPINDDEKKILKNDLVYFPHILFPACANMIWKVMAGDKLSREEHSKLRQLCLCATRFQKGGDTTGGAISMTGWLKYFGNMFGFQDFITGNKGIIDFVKRFIDETDDKMLEEKVQKGFLRTYLREMKINKEKNTLDNDAMFSEEQLIMVAVDFMFPALSAVPAVLGHCIKYMLHNPKVMKRVQKEIDDVIGYERLPGLDDRKNLLYTEATIREVLRIETLTPLSVTHRAVQTTTLNNYTVPADTIVITNLAGMHNDPDLWGDPECFRPNRFLTEDETKLVKDYTFPFGLGRRVCAGETFARFVIFIIFASLMQHFNFELVEGEPTGLNDKLSGLIVQPKNTWIRCKRRY